jgi:hypothetical protein
MIHERKQYFELILLLYSALPRPANRRYNINIYLFFKFEKLQKLMFWDGESFCDATLQRIVSSLERDILSLLRFFFKTFPNVLETRLFFKRLSQKIFLSKFRNCKNWHFGTAEVVVTSQRTVSSPERDILSLLRIFP